MLMLFGSPLWSQDVYYKYQIKDAAELNKIYNATGGASWTKKQNWPINSGILFSVNYSYGIQYVKGDTLIIHYLPPQKDTGIIQMRVKEIRPS